MLSSDHQDQVCRRLMISAPVVSRLALISSAPPPNSPLRFFRGNTEQRHSHHKGLDLYHKSAQQTLAKQNES